MALDVRSPHPGVDCRSFAVVFSGQKRARYDAEAGTVLGKWPIPNKLLETPAWAGGLWIRRVLVRAQEGPLTAAAISATYAAYAAARLDPESVTLSRRVPLPHCL
jgi:hypothetical protein